MNDILVIARKEIRQIARSKNVLISAILFVVVFGFVSAPAFGADQSGNAGNSIDQLGFYLVLTLGIFIGYIFTGQAFFREKQEHVIETLLCTPLSLRRIWIGKVLGITVPAYMLTLFAAVLIIGVASAANGAIILPGFLIFLHIFLIVPLFIASAAGLIGFSQLLLGIRENQILNFGIIFALILLITFTREVLGASFVISWQVLVSLFFLAVLLLLATGYLTRFLDKERIVTTIPE
jgi:ABC-2 type transport system permease protein